MNKYPMLLSSIPKQTIWGGNLLREKYNKTAPFSNIAESWELSVRDNATSVITNGKYQGQKLSDYINIAKNDILGEKSAKFDRFPILIKFIDAEDDLSIQVHPHNEYAYANENDMGKTEMWVIMEASSDANLIYGLKDSCSSEEFKDAVAKNNTEQMLKSVSVKPGDVYFIPAGQVHAIGKHILLAEIQQNSDTTYRLYDYNRRQSDGSLRELHIDKALDVIVTRREEEIDAIRFSHRDCAPKGGELLCAFEDFSVRRFYSSDHNEIKLCADSSSFISVLVLDSKNAKLSSDDFSATIHQGDSYFIPAGYGTFTVSGTSTLLVTTLT